MNKKHVYFIGIFLGIFFSFLTLFAQEENPRVLVHILSYLAKDYSGAVAHGKIVNEAEYQEQREFVSTAVNIAKSLPEFSSNHDLLAQLLDLKNLIFEKAEASKVTELSNHIQNQVIQISKIPVLPSQAPDLIKARSLYEKNCISCHGVEGKGDGPLAKNLNPAPVSFWDEERMASMSSFQAFNSIRLGIQGTAMLPNQQLSDAEVWDLAFYVTSLRHGSKLSTPASSIPVARQYLEKTKFTYLKGEWDQARRFALMAYLEGVEPVEVKLRSLDASLVNQIEEKMAAFRTQLEHKMDAQHFDESLQQVQALLDRAENLLSNSSHSKWFVFFMAFSIILREGFEAILILVTILGVVRMLGAKQAIPWVHGGWVSALLCGVLAWIFSGYLLKMSGADRETMEGLTSLLAMSVLLYVGFWLHGKSEIGKWTSYIKKQMDNALQGSKLFGIAMVSFLAVFREVFETVLFLRALWLEGIAAEKSFLIAGVGVSFALIFVLAYLLLKWSVKLPIGKLFAISSFVMVLLALILTGKGVRALQMAGHVSIHPLSMPLNLPFFGLYPSLETTLSQIVVFVLVMLVWTYQKRQAHANS